MDFHERMAIGHALHTFWNPISEPAVDELVAAMDLAPKSRVLDVACGPGAWLFRVVERYGASGIGVDVSAGALERARATAARTHDADVTFVDQDGAAYVAACEEQFDLVCLVGASWIWKGYRGTLEALRPRVRPQGLLLFGEPFLRVAEPPTAWCEIEGVTPDAFTTLDGLRTACRDAGFRLLYLLGSTEREWDRYEMLQSLATDRWVRAHPDHPDRDDLLAFQDRFRENYLRYGRDVLGFATLLLRRTDGRETSGV
jgi:SAM-dependent methyltransferase